MNVGLDVGYSAVKVVNSGDPNKWKTFASVVGTPDIPQFPVDGTGTGIMLLAPSHVLVGEEAVIQSRDLDRREDRHWIESTAWYNLFLAALTELTTATRAELHIVTGLPLSFYSDKDIVRGRLLGEHKPVRMRGEVQATQCFQVVAVTVIPQPFGTLFSVALDDRGGEAVKMTGSTGIIDVGGKTTNLLTVQGLKEIRRASISVDKGAWSAVASLREWLAANYPDRNMRDNEVMDVLVSRKITYYETVVDISDGVHAVLEPMARDILTAARRLWNGGADLNAVLITGGGAHLIGPYVKAQFRHARVVSHPVFANALGYWRFAQALQALAGK